MADKYTSSIDWRYHRNGCSTCLRAEDFLSRHKIGDGELMLASKAKLGAADALKLASQADHIYASKHTKHVHFDMKNDRPGDDQLLEIMLGPTGNLRAPIIRKGKNLLVGFNEESYKQILT